jgi:mono/diheme cytochrome c family protein
LALLPLLPLLLLGACDDESTEPNFEYMPDMVSSAAVESFSASAATRNGRAMMAPPAGTVPRGYEPLHYAAGPEEAARAGRELSNPMPDVELVRRRGEVGFKRWCSPCHGAEGLGDGLVARKFPRPPSLVADHARGLPDGQIFHIVTFGQGVMPSYAQQVVAEDRWKIVRHVRQMQKIAGAARPVVVGAATGTGTPTATPTPTPTGITAGTTTPTPTGATPVAAPTPAVKDTGATP